MIKNFELISANLLPIPCVLVFRLAPDWNSENHREFYEKPANSTRLVVLFNFALVLNPFLISLYNAIDTLFVTIYE